MLTSKRRQFALFAGPFAVLSEHVKGQMDTSSSADSVMQAQNRDVQAVVMLLAAVVLFALGQLSEIFHTQGSHSAVPAWADPATLLSYVLLFLGTILLPRRPLPQASRTRIVVDGLMTLTALAAFSWYYLFGPALADWNVRPSAWTDVAYPALDLVLALGIIVLSSHLREVMSRPLLLLILASLVLIIAGDSIRIYQYVHTLPAAGTALDFLRILGYVLVEWPRWG